MSNEFRVTSDTITPELRRIAAQMSNTRPLMAACGKQMEADLRGHFKERDARPNRYGWPKKHFWARIRRATSLQDVTNEKAAVTIGDPAFTQKVYGGTIYPKRGKALTIPNNSEAYKKGSPREWDDQELDFIPLHDGGLIGMLVKTLRTLVRYTKKGIRAGKGVGGEIMYWLVARAKQEPDREAWPRREKLEASVLARARAMLARMPRTSR